MAGFDTRNLAFLNFDNLAQPDFFQFPGTVQAPYAQAFQQPQPQHQQHIHQHPQPHHHHGHGQQVQQPAQLAPAPTTVRKAARKGGKGGKIYNCPCCDKTYSRKTHLDRHLAVHGGQPLFVCETCGKHMFRKDHYRYHLRTHSDDRPFPCTHANCDKAFRQRGALKRHLVSHENRARRMQQHSQRRQQAANNAAAAANHAHQPHPMAPQPPAQAMPSLMAQGVLPPNLDLSSIDVNQLMDNMGHPGDVNNLVQILLQCRNLLDGNAAPDMANMALHQFLGGPVGL